MQQPAEFAYCSESIVIDCRSFRLIMIECISCIVCVTAQGSRRILVCKDFPFNDISTFSKSIVLQDALDALNGRTYDGRDLRITIDAGRPAGGGGGGGRDYGRR